MTRSLDDRWIRRFHQGPEDAPALICFPHAGGSASYYSSFSARLQSRLQVFALQYPGRQDRLREPLLSTIDEFAEEAFAALEPILKQPIALFGHSMGALIAFEVTVRMNERLNVAPLTLFVSGRRAPSSYRVEDDVHLRDDAGLVVELRSLSGTDLRVLDDPDVLGMVLPAMRSDYTAVERYVYRPGPKLDCPLVALIGDTDPKADVDEVRAWQDHTSARFEMHTFIGGHFYLAEHSQAIADIIAGNLSV